MWKALSVTVYNVQYKLDLSAMYVQWQTTRVPVYYAVLFSSRPKHYSS